ncbi:ANTAR domain-containing protein [Kineococcus sp. SYSU DK003]|uniref:ANTAR domain-containing protein n=1 Tax=Kineococcus sp. SYSU DK003 TaxID=3383124 RepID=UPI003D7DB51D
MQVNTGRSAVLGDQVRSALGTRWVVSPTEDDGEVVDRVEQALSVLEALLDLGWVDADRVEELLLGDPLAPPSEVGAAVRSLAEDLAVTRLRARTAGERSRETVARARAVTARSEQLAAEALRRVQESRRARDEARDRTVALEQEADQLRTALRNRPHIEHAVGVVMHALGCDRDTAWDVLSRLSQQTNVKVRTVADALTERVGRGGGLPPDVLAALRAVAAARPPREPGP